MIPVVKINLDGVDARSGDRKNHCRLRVISAECRWIVASWKQWVSPYNGNCLTRGESEEAVRFHCCPIALRKLTVTPPPMPQICRHGS